MNVRQKMSPEDRDHDTILSSFVIGRSTVQCYYGDQIKSDEMDKALGTRHIPRIFMRGGGGGAPGVFNKAPIYFFFTKKKFFLKNY